MSSAKLLFETLSILGLIILLLVGYYFFELRLGIYRSVWAGALLTIVAISGLFTEKFRSRPSWMKKGYCFSVLFPGGALFLVGLSNQVLKTDGPNHWHLLLFFPGFFYIIWAQAKYGGFSENGS